MSTISKALPNPPANFSTTLSSGVSSSDLTIPLNSVSGLGTEGVGVIYAKDSEGEAIATSLEFIHWTNTSGNNLTLSDTGDRGLSGSYNGAQAHSSGDTFEVWVHPEYHFYDWGVTEHNADGTHKSGITLTSPTITSPSLTTFSTLNAPEGFLVNGKIVPSVASNNLTVAIKGMDGNDPSATNPVYVRINNTVRSITSALSVTTNAGQNSFNAGSSALATKEIDYFVFLIWNTSANAVTIGYSRLVYGTLVSDFNRVAGTDERFLEVNTAPNSTDSLVCVGRFATTLSAGAGYTWTVPTFTGNNLIQRPIYESRKLSWSPTLTGFSGSPTVFSASYSVIGSRVRYELYFTGTSNAAECVASLPFKAYPTNNGACPFYAPVVNNGTWEDGVASVNYDSASLIFGKEASSIGGNVYAGFTTSGSKGAFVYDAFFDLV